MIDLCRGDFMTISFSSGGSGFDWNMVIAIFAILGVVISSFISMITLKQTKNANNKFNRISTFDMKFKHMTYCYGFLTNCIKSKDLPSLELVNEFELNSIAIVFLYKNTKELIILTDSLIAFCKHGEPLINDSTLQFKEELAKLKNEKDDIYTAFCIFTRQKVFDLSQELYIH